MVDHEDDAPSLQLVGNQSDQRRDAIEVEWAQQSLEESLRELAANLMRVARGAGRPASIGRQCNAVVGCFEDYRKTAGHYPSAYDVAATLRVEDDFATFDRCSDREVDWALAVTAMVRGSLQIAASRLLNQRTQEAAGETELFEGLVTIEQQREENRKAVQDPSTAKALLHLQRQIAKGKRKPR